MNSVVATFEKISRNYFHHLGFQIVEKLNRNRIKGGEIVDWKFSLHDDQSDLVIGYCKDIVGLDGQIYSDADISYHQIELIQFAFCNNFKEHLLKSKESINRLVYICTIDKNKNPIGKYSFFIFDNLYYHKVGFPENPTNIIFKGSLDDVLSNKELEIWNE